MGVEYADDSRNDDRRTARNAFAQGLRIGFTDGAPRRRPFVGPTARWRNDRV